MASDLNNVTLVARLARDPELRTLASGQAVCDLRVAYNTSRKTADGSWEDEGHFVNVSVWGRAGEALARNLTKGERVGIIGRLQHRTWTDNDGNRREAHSIVAQQVQYLDPRKGQQQTEPASAPARKPAEPAAPAPAPAADDDIPF